MNDRGYGVIRNIQDAQYGGRRVYADILTPDFSLVCKAVGLPHERVAKIEDFDAALDRALATPGPRMIEIDMVAIGPFARVLPVRPLAQPANRHKGRVMAAEAATLEPTQEEEVVHVAKTSATLPVRLRAMTWEADGVHVAGTRRAGRRHCRRSSQARMSICICRAAPCGNIRCAAILPIARATGVAIRAVSGGLSSQFVHRKLAPGRNAGGQPAAQQLSAG